MSLLQHLCTWSCNGTCTCTFIPLRPIRELTLTLDFMNSWTIAVLDSVVLLNLTWTPELKQPRKDRKDNTDVHKFSFCRVRVTADMWYNNSVCCQRRFVFVAQGMLPQNHGFRNMSMLRLMSDIERKWAFTGFVWIRIRTIAHVVKVW
jgi:hypothetical protein